MSAKQNNCSLHEILQTPCGSSRDKENHVVLSECNADSSAHLLSCHLSKCGDVTKAELIMARAGIRGMTATQITRITICPKNLDVNEIEKFSKLRNIQFEEKGIRVWRSYRVGRGKEVPFDELVSLSQENTGLAVSEEFFHCRDTRVYKCQDTITESSVSNSSDSEIDMFECSEPGCVKSFKTFSEIESHLDIGDHCVKEERQSETLRL